MLKKGQKNVSKLQSDYNKLQALPTAQSLPRNRDGPRGFDIEIVDLIAKKDCSLEEQQTVKRYEVSH